MPNITTGSFSPSTMPIPIASRGPISSEELRSFISACSNDFNTIADFLNNYALKLAGALPNETGINALSAQKLDGANLYADASAAETKDRGLFWNTEQNRPMTIYETFILYIQLMANIQNGLREGVSIGSKAVPVEIGIGSPIEVEWPYLDGLFEVYLFSISGGVISKFTPTSVSVNDTTKVLSITYTGSTTQVYGYVWHPVFTFGR